MRAPDVMIDVEDTSADTDVFASTDIDQPVANGYAHYYVASTVNTATIEVPQIGHRPGNTNLIPKLADGIPKWNEVIPYRIPIVKGSRPVVVLGGTTGTVHHRLCVFYD